MCVFLCSPETMKKGTTYKNVSKEKLGTNFYNLMTSVAERLALWVLDEQVRFPGGSIQKNNLSKFVQVGVSAVPPSKLYCSGTHSTNNCLL